MLLIEEKEEDVLSHSTAVHLTIKDMGNKNDSWHISWSQTSVEI